ncbi:transposase [Ureibacillus terrenus]|uniref:transposase n=1 Tax=Ureibacillus TaxID=160795 RepID=UPI00399D6BC5
MTLSLRKKIIHIIWDFEKVNHEEEMNAIHPQLFEEFPALLELDQLVGSFRTLLHAKASDGLRKWLVAYKDSKFQYIDSFLNGIKEDQRAVWHSIVLPWSNGPVEGQINRLKTLKRLMYGRASFHLLRNRFLYRWD